MHHLMTLKPGDAIVYQAADVRWCVLGVETPAAQLPLSEALRLARAAVNGAGGSVWVWPWAEAPRRLGGAVPVLEALR